MSIHMDTDGAPFPNVEDDLRRQIMGLRARLASAEAEVARLKALLEAKRPYEPKVGDVVTWGTGYALFRVKDGGVMEWIKREQSDSVYTLAVDSHPIRPATPAERAAAGLPAEAPAKPEVLPEHLALLEASAAYWSTYGMGEDKWERMIQAGKDLLAAVARRDGGPK